VRAELGLLSVDERSNSSCGIGLLAGEDVAVDVEGECDRCVTEALGRYAHVRAGGEEMRGVRVAQVVQTDARQPRTLHQSSERTRHHIGVSAATVGHREHEAGVDPRGSAAQPLLELVRPPRLQHADRCRVDVNDAARPRRLHVAE
jgi:hypothetical protein